MSDDKKSKTYLVGAGISSLSAAVYLIKDGNIKGENIIIFDESNNIGGSLDAENLPSGEGYFMRGIRAFEEKAYSCLYDLMSSIPSLNVSGKTLREEFVDYNRKNKSYSKSRLFKDGQTIDSRPLKLNAKDRLNLLHLLTSRESSLENREVREYFTPSFFTSNFWYEFSTVFSFQPWHSLIEFKRYTLRFIQTFPNIDDLEDMESSPYNQYEFLVLPIVDWLKKQGVTFVTNTKITDLDFVSDKNGEKVSRIYYNKSGETGEIIVDENDFVFVTLGSIVANSSIGGMKKVPPSNEEEKNSSWTLWENISKNHPEFGKPSVFNTHIDKSKWVSFTITFRDSTFFNLMEKYIDEKINSFGGINLIDSNWLISIVLFYKPYFINQPDNVKLCWGYGLFSEEKGNFVKKKMSECNGEEILTELVCHLGFEKYLDEILKSSVCIPCVMPYITSLFLPRKKSDRPLVVPHGSINFAFLGQYTEISNDVVFTVEHSIRSAQTAVYSLLKLDKKVSPIYKGIKHTDVLYKALKTILR